MHQILKNRVLPVMAGAAIVVGGLNVASYAADGHPLLLGGNNSESHTASLKNTGSGPALSVTTSKKAPPFSVNSHKVVKNLNAGAVDGLDAKVLGRAYKFAIPKNTPVPFAFQLKGLPKGQYALSLNIATAAATGPLVPFCNVADSTSQFSVVSYGQDIGDTTSDIAINSASGIVKLAKKGQVAVFCDGADTTYNEGGSKNVVVLTPLAKVTTTKGTALAPPAPKSRFGR
jgi:hypothetical protein